MAMMQMAQTDLIQQLSHLQENFTQVMRELAETRRRQNVQQQMMKEMMDFISKQYGGNCKLVLLSISFPC
jgi:heat shock transcription factor 4